MELKNRKNLFIIMIVSTIAAVIILTVTGVAAKNRDYKPASWIIKTYGSNVALFNGENLEMVYEGIVIDNLPQDDIEILKNGIAFPTRSEAEQAIEDYDG